MARGSVLWRKKTRIACERVQAQKTCAYSSAALPLPHMPFARTSRVAEVRAHWSQSLELTPSAAYGELAAAVQPRATATRATRQDQATCSAPRGAERAWTRARYEPARHSRSPPARRLSRTAAPPRRQYS